MTRKQFFASLVAPFLAVSLFRKKKDEWVPIKKGDILIPRIEWPQRMSDDLLISSTSYESGYYKLLFYRSEDGGYTWTEIKSGKE